MTDTPSESWEATAPKAYRRLDAALADCHPATSRTRWKTLIADGHVCVNGEVVTHPNTPIPVGARLACTFPPPPPPAYPLQPLELPLDILFEDADLLAINKPAGLVIHPAAGHAHDTFVNALLHYLNRDIPDAAELYRMGIVHRLDKDTTGVLLAAKNETTRAALSAQFAERQTEKHYLALVHGAPSPARGTINQPIGRDPRNRKKMAIRPEAGRPSITHYQTLATADGISLLRLHIETGRTHQIRVHLSSIGHPVCGDSLYSRARQTPIEFSRQMLHAHTLKITHPRTHDPLTLIAPPPADFLSALHQLFPSSTLETFLPF